MMVDGRNHVRWEVGHPSEQLLSENHQPSELDYCTGPFLDVCRGLLTATRAWIKGYHIFEGFDQRCGRRCEVKALS